MSNDLPDSPEESAFEKENYMESGQATAKGEFFPGQLLTHQHEGSQIVLECEHLLKLQVRALSDDLIHFCYAPDGHLGDGFSYAAIADHLPEPPEIQVSEEEEHVSLKTNNLHIQIAKNGLTTRIINRAGIVLSEDEKGFHWEPHKSEGGNIVQYSRRRQPREHFFGLGDKSCHSEIRDRRFELWGSDTYGYGSETDPLYKNIPFFIGIHRGLAYGIFFDNTSRSFFDFGKERKDITSFWAQGGLMNFYFINGPTVQDVVRRFAQLTGTPELPPKWALGYHQCKWSYKTEKELRGIADGFLKHKIPCDALYVDIDYMDGYRCFTWNLESFPKPGEIIRDLERQGFKTVAIIDPGIKIDPDYFVYKEGIAGDHFCRQADGDLYTGQVWPGPCHFPDFTKPVTRDWWAGLFKGLIEDDGIAGIWNDMNEPADFNDAKTFPNHIRHDYDGHPCSHRKAHNIYGTQMIRATREGLMHFNDGKRPFAITRSAYAGAWRYASAWTGDNTSSWEHLKIANIQCQRLNLSGFSFVGSDIGGFSEDPEGELFTRWIQLGIFHPFCRTHSSGDQGDQEPWSFGEPYTSIVRKFIELRYQLLPTIYSAFYQHILTGDPILRPLLYLQSDDPETYHRADEFLMGDHLLICPICEKKSEGRWLYLPAGSWYNFWNDEKASGGEEIFTQAPLDVIPFFIRAAAVVVLDPVRQYSWEDSSEPQRYHFYLPTASGETVQTTFYHDEGDGYGYLEGLFCLRTFSSELADGVVKLTMIEKGELPAPEAVLELHGLTFEPNAILIDGKEVANPKEIHLPASFESIEIHLPK